MSNIETNEVQIQVRLVSIKTAQLSFRAAKSRYSGIRGLVDAGFLAPDYQSMNLNGYLLQENATQDSFWVCAVPREPGVTGNRSFFVDDSGLIRVEEKGGQKATATSPLI